jgi:hypothetical protein
VLVIAGDYLGLGPEVGPMQQTWACEVVITLGPEVGPKGQIWTCYRGKRWLAGPKDKYGHVREGTGGYHGTRGWSNGKNIGM